MNTSAVGDITINIDELDLGELPPARRFEVAASFERELERLIRLRGEGLDPAALQSLGARTEPPTVEIDLSMHDRPTSIGVALANTIFGLIS